MSIYTSKGCFGCGTENPHGLKIDPRPEGDWLVADVIIPPFLRGFSRVVHGGISALLLDELMAMSVGAAVNKLAATAKIEVSFRRPMFVEKPVRVQSRYTGQDGGVHTAEGKILDEEGNELALGRGKFVAISGDSYERFVGRSDGTV